MTVFQVKFLLSTNSVTNRCNIMRFSRYPRWKPYEVTPRKLAAGVVVDNERQAAARVS